MDIYILIHSFFLGFGFITFDSSVTAQLVISKQGTLYLNDKKVNQKKTIHLFKKVEVKSAQPKQQKSQFQQNQNQNQIFRNQNQNQNQYQGQSGQGFNNFDMGFQGSNMMYMNPMMMSGNMFMPFQPEFPGYTQTPNQIQSTDQIQSFDSEKNKDENVKIENAKTEDELANATNANPSGNQQPQIQMQNSGQVDFSQGQGAVDPAMMDAYFKMFYGNGFGMNQFDPSQNQNQIQNNQYHMQNYQSNNNQNQNYNSNSNSRSNQRQAYDKREDRRDDRSESRDRGREYKGRPRGERDVYKTREERGEGSAKREKHDEKKSHPYAR